MKLWDRIVALGRTRLFDPARRQVQAWVSPSQGGMWVDSRTALTMSAYYLAIRLIAETIAMLPWSVYEHEDDEGRRKRRLPRHRVTRLLEYKANPELHALRARELLLRWALATGNGYAEIERGLDGSAAALWPIHPGRVQRLVRVDGDLAWEVRGDEHAVLLPARDMFHLAGPSDDPFLGLSVVQLAARSIGVGLAQDEYTARFYQQGTLTPGVLTYPRKLSDVARDNLRKSWRERYGGVENAGTPPVLEEGLDWKGIGVSPKDAQLIESKGYTVEDVARWFRVPPHKLMKLDRATWGNIEHQSIEFVTDTLMPWVARLEAEADLKLLRKDSQFTRIDVDVLLRGDASTRAEKHRQYLHMGVLSPNEIREELDLNPIGAEGDKRMVQGAMTTLDRVGEVVPAGDPESQRGVTDQQVRLVSSR